MDASVFQRTKDTLGQVISKPPITDKLLSRPPFRYLHDIISSVLKNSGFFKDLYSAQELDAKNVQDKDAKVDFLQKAIDVLSFTMDEVVKAKPLKIVAGQEPEKTNEFLQLLGLAIIKKMDSAEGVKRVLNGEKPGDQPAKTKGKKNDKGKGAKKESPESEDSPEDKDRPGTVRSSRPKESSKVDKPARSKGKSEPAAKTPSKGKSEPAAKTPSKGKSGLVPKTPSKGKSEPAAKTPSKGKSEPAAKTTSKGKSEPAAKTSKGKSGLVPKTSSKGKSGAVSKTSSKDKSGIVGKTLSKGKVEGLGSTPSVSDNEEDEKSDSVGEEREHSEHLLEPTTSKTTAQESEGADDVSRPTHKRPRDAEVNLSEGADEGTSSDSKVSRPPSAKGDRKRSHRLPNNIPKGEARIAEPILPLSDRLPYVAAEEAIPALISQEKRPGTVRLAPPKVVRREDVPDDLTERGPAAHLGEIPTTVILDAPEGDDADIALDDDDSQFLIEDSINATKLLRPPDEVFADNGAVLDEKPEGALTKNIVAMKEHLEGDLEKETSQVHVYPVITEAQRRKERELVMAEIERLQSSIQVLCKSANPLGKIMDYVQEDMESMQKELEMWQAENVRDMDCLHREESITERELQPLSALLEEIDAKIREQKDMISATKSNILRNDVKTQQMLHTLTFGSS